MDLPKPPSICSFRALPEGIPLVSRLVYWWIVPVYLFQVWGFFKSKIVCLHLAKWYLRFKRSCPTLGHLGCCPGLSRWFWLLRLADCQKTTQTITQISWLYGHQLAFIPRFAKLRRNRCGRNPSRLWGKHRTKSNFDAVYLHMSRKQTGICKGKLYSSPVSGWRASGIGCWDGRANPSRTPGSSLEWCRPSFNLKGFLG